MCSHSLLLHALILPKSFLLYFFEVAGTWWWSITGPLYGSGSVWAGCCLLLPLTSHALFHFMGTCIGLSSLISEWLLRAVWMCFTFLCQAVLVCDCHVDSSLVFSDSRCFSYLLSSVLTGVLTAFQISTS